MPARIVHPLTDDLIDAMYASAHSTYLEQPAVEPSPMSPWRRRAVDPARCWVAQDHGRVVASLRTVDDTLSVPGPPGHPAGVVDADLLTLVSVAPTHRRQGLLTRMLDASLTEAHDRGCAVSVLVAAEWPIYGRFGYAPSAWEARHELDVRARGAVFTGPVPTGSVREVDPVEASDLAPAVYEAEAGGRAGLIGRPEFWWDRLLGRVGEDRAVVRLPGPMPRQIVHVAGDGTVDGWLQWTVTGDSVGVHGLGRLQVEDLLAATPDAYAALWRFVFGVDLVGQVVAPGRPVDDALPHLVADGRVVRSTVGDAMWLRILDVPAALSARGYAGADELTLEVVDDAVGGWASGRYTLTAGPDGASCVPAGGRSADVTVPQSTLASIYLGGVRAAVLAGVGGVDEHTAGATSRLDALFATPLAPWRATDF